MYLFECFLLGIALAMDAFSVSLANGLNDPGMKKGKIFSISGMFAVFQALMPFIGWVLLKTIMSQFAIIEKFVPYVALILLAWIGIKMLIEGIKNGQCEVTGACEVKKLGIGALLVQAVATSIDALSAGLAMTEYTLIQVLLGITVIALVTFVICTAGVFLGKKFGTMIAGKANILGGAILIFIGLEIFIKGVFGL